MTSTLDMTRVARVETSALFEASASKVEINVPNIIPSGSNVIRKGLFFDKNPSSFV